MASRNPAVAVIGSGPAGLMAADVLSAVGVPVTLFEKRKSPGRKLLVAGSSGLNITNGAPLDEFISAYTGPSEFWRPILSAFPPASWIQFIESFGFKTFLGTSDRYFVEGMKASRFLQAWVARLKERGVEFQFDHEVTSLHPSAEFAAQCFALGGGSWEPHEKPLRWPRIFIEAGLKFNEFRPSNVGYRVAWKERFLKEAEGKPLKQITLCSSRGRRDGDAMVTSYGIEGTPVYFVGATGRVTLDLKPDLSEAQILARLRAVKENFSPIRRVAKQLKLCEASQALVYHHAPRDILEDAGLARMAALIKAFPLDLLGPQSIDEAISSAGGLDLNELDSHLMLRRYPGIFCVGEMLDWDAPTGGFLIQGCVSQGFVAARGILAFLGIAPA